MKFSFMAKMTYNLGVTYFQHPVDTSYSWLSVKIAKLLVVIPHLCQCLHVPVVM